MAPDRQRALSAPHRHPAPSIPRLALAALALAVAALSAARPGGSRTRPRPSGLALRRRPGRACRPRPAAGLDRCARRRPDEYQPGTFALEADGVTHGPFEVGVRLKGGLGSFRGLEGKAAFKVKVDEYVDGQTFFGLEKLTLNNMVQDPSMVHETLAYELFRSLGVPASRTGYAFVRVNGESFGLYLNVETLDAIALPDGSPRPATSTRATTRTTSVPVPPASSRSTRGKRGRATTSRR